MDQSISITIPFIAFLSYCGLLVLVAKGPRSKIATIFLYYLVLMAIWSFGSFMMRTGVWPGPLTWNRFMLLGMTGIPFVFFHFSQVILQRKTILVPLGYLIGAVFLVSSLQGLIVKEASLNLGYFTYILGPLAQPFAILGGGYILASAVFLTREGIKSPVSFWSSRLAYPSIGSVLMLIGSTLNLFPVIGQYPVDITTNTINALLLAYAIYRYQLLNITITLRKGLVYSILTAIITITYLIAVYFLEIMARTKVGLFIALLMAAGIAAFFDPVKNSLRVWIDKAVFREQYDYRETLKEFSRLMTTILDLDRLTQSTLDLLTKAMQASSGALFLTSYDGSFVAHASINLNQEVAKAVRIDKTSPIVRWLSTRSEPILKRDQIETLPDFQYLWQKELEDFEELETQIMVGIKMQNELTGVILLSSKTSGDPFSDDDEQLLLTIANEAAVAIKNARIYSEAKTQAIRDELTQLYNYRFFHEFLDKEIARCQRSSQGLAVIFMDLDLFKAYNDIFGHQAGDEALVKISRGIMDSIRTADVAARHGGDEFAVVLPGADKMEALRVAERIRDSVQQSFPGVGYGNQLLTVSLGLARFPEHGDNKQQLLTAADQALLQAKHSGRNRVVMYQSLMDKEEEMTASSGMNTEAERDFLKKQVEEAYLSTIYTLAAAINARDNYTYLHSEMVTLYSVALAEALGLSEEQKKIIRHAAMLHDIGKIGIPEYILNKPGNLTPDEQEVIRRHVNIAESIISQTPYLRKVAQIILFHHEAYNGLGYPNGLKGEEIPLEARILSVADVFHAMTSDRPYRQAMAKETAILQLQSLSGLQFDPDLVPVFVRLVRKPLIELRANRPPYLRVPV